jgi:hypothetical protein
MACNKLTTQVKYTITAPGKSLIKLVGLLLLVVFVGRLAADSLYNCTGAKKVNITLTAEDQDEGDNKDEMKYADQYLQFLATPANFEPASLFELARIKPRFISIIHFLYPHYLTVLTPPPNC